MTYYAITIANEIVSWMYLRTFAAINLSIRSKLPLLITLIAVVVTGLIVIRTFTAIKLSGSKAALLPLQNLAAKTTAVSEELAPLMGILLEGIVGLLLLSAAILAALVFCIYQLAFVVTKAVRSITQSPSQ